MATPWTPRRLVEHTSHAFLVSRSTKISLRKIKRVAHCWAYEGKRGDLLVHFPGLEERRWPHMAKWLNIVETTPSA
jgi:hypothetical protein